ncbi:Yt1Q-like protein [Rhizophagus irregularis]|uniref:Yt1Q-like protein n=1 Tax=Rhizophagus irregularis TaxID=588596 RepID=A0A2N0QN29_9GLOM|nr:Yt1Q-like protein [Rhizophagus irregularis]
MAQLIKLQDYISRYQIDLNRYPAQFIRMKKNGWNRMKSDWESGDSLNTVQNWEQVEEAEEEKKPKQTIFKKLFSKKRSSDKEETIDVTEDNEENLPIEEELIDDETTLYFEPTIVYRPQTTEELKKIFLDQFFHFQIKWASSTLREKSYVDPKYLREGFLRTILQSLPDNYLVLYYPIIKVKKAPVELDIIILTPLECLCITMVEHENLAVYIGNSERERFWMKKVGDTEKKLLNPLIQLNRMEAIIAQLFHLQDVDMPIRNMKTGCNI